MKQLRIFGLLIAVLIMGSCNKEEDPSNDIGDVMIVAKQSGTETLYGLSIYAYTSGSFQSVTVENEDNPPLSYELQPFQGYQNSFYYETPDTSFTTTKPLASTYSFTATFENGDTKTFQNTLTNKVLPIPTFVKCEYKEFENLLEVSWEPIMGANSYSVSIMNGSELVFSGPQLKNTQLFYYVSRMGSGWAIDFAPEAGKNYIVRLFAYQNEPGGGDRNMQSISIAEKTVEWGN